MLPGQAVVGGYRVETITVASVGAMKEVLRKTLTGSDVKCAHAVEHVVEGRYEKALGDGPGA